MVTQVASVALVYASLLPIVFLQWAAFSVIVVKQPGNSVLHVFLLVILSPVTAIPDLHLQLPVAKALHVGSVALVQLFSTVSAISVPVPLAESLHLT